MRPAFSSTKQATAFALLLLVILLLPVGLRGRLLPPHRENYLQQGWDSFGDYPYLYRQIFEETNTIDIAFVGSSRIWLGIDAVYVQQKLSEQLGRPAVVRTIAWGWGGYDKFYFAMRDLLEHRHVRLLVFNDEGQSINLMDPLARRWFRLGDNVSDLAGFPLRLQLDYYFSAIQGMPRNLLDNVRPNLRCELSATDIAQLEQTYFCTNPASCLGSLGLKQGFSQTPIFQEGHPPFELFTPPPRRRSAARGRRNLFGGNQESVSIFRPEDAGLANALRTKICWVSREEKCTHSFTACAEPDGCRPVGNPRTRILAGYFARRRDAVGYSAQKIICRPK